MPKYLDIDGLRTLWAQITNKIGQESDATAEALEGKADLVEGKIPTSQLPSYVDDVLEYANKASFPATGESGKIYLDLATNLAYRWGGTAYTEISPSLALGTTSSTAYRGDYGAAAYTHAVTNKGIAKSSGLYKITTNAEGHVTAATAVVKADITGLGIPAQDTTYENATTTTNGLMSSTDKTKLDGINLSALVKSVNGVTPDSNGNVAIEVGGGTVSGDYLPLTGGTLSGTLKVPYLLIEKSNNWPSIGFNLASGINRAGFMYDGATNNRLMFKQYGADMDSASTRYGENYILPKPTEGITAEKWYSILTSKNAVTVAQGGTGATTPEAARTALGITPANIGALPSSGGTLTGTLTINNSNSTGGFVALMEDSEGGTIQIGSKTGAYTYEIDAYNDEILRIHTAVKNPNGGMKTLTWNGKSGNLTADGFTGSWLGNTIGINKGGTGATTAADARTALGITPANIGAAPTSHASTATTYGAASASNYGHAMASSTTPKALGTAAVGSETAKFARGDHVHALPALTSCTGTLTVAKGGTGKTTLTSGYALIGNGTSAVSLRAITNNTEKGSLGWTSTTGTNLVTSNTLAYWNGSYNGTSSNLSVLGTITTGVWNGSAIPVTHGGTGATDAATARTNLGITDNKVTQTLTEDAEKNTNWYLLASSSQSTGTRGAVFTKDLRVQSYAGTTSVAGEVEMIIGNSTASGTAGNKEGFITLYSKGSSYHMIKTATVSTGITHTLPAKSGTILNTGTFVASTTAPSSPVTGMFWVDIS